MLPVNSLGYQHVQAEAEGWIDPKKNICSHRLQDDEDTDTYRVLSYWENEQLEGWWVRQYKELPFFLARHRASMLSKLVDWLESSRVAMRVEWLDRLLDPDESNEGYDSDANEVGFRAIDF